MYQSEITVTRGFRWHRFDTSPVSKPASARVRRHNKPSEVPVERQTLKRFLRLETLESREVLAILTVGVFVG